MMSHMKHEERETESVPQAVGTPLSARDDEQNTDTIPNADVCEKAVDHEFVNTGRTAKTADIGASIRQIPYSTFILGLEDTIQKSSDYLF